MEASVAPSAARVDHLTRLQWPLVAAVALLGVAFVFHSQIGTGFVLLFGDHYDGFIEVAILQHWNNVLHGAQPWNVTGYFHPYPDSLGYNDAYLIYGVLYALFRAIGSDVLLGAELVHMTIKTFGLVGMYLLLRTICRYRITTSMLGAALFTISINTVAQSNHGLE